MLCNVLNWLFEKYDDNHIGYCILRNYEKLPEVNIGNDIDILIDYKDIEKNELILKLMCKELGLTCIRIAKRQYVHQWYFIKQGCPEFKTLQLDFQFDGEWNGNIYLKGDYILDNRISYKNFYIPRKSHEALILLFASLIWGGFVKEKYNNRIYDLVNNDYEEFYKILRSSIGDYSTVIIDNIKNNKMKKCEKLVKELRKSIKKSSIKNYGLIFTLVKKIKFYLHELKIRIKPPGISIVVLGSDGVGKSTFINGMKEILKRYFKEEFFCLRHSRPRFLKDPGDYIYKKEKGINTININSRDNVKKPNNMILSFVRLIYYTLDYIIGYIIVFMKPLRKTGVVILDRYYYDFFVDPERNRMNLPQFIYTIFYLFIPKPNIVIYLDAEPEVIYSRKQELEIVEIKKQREKYRKLSEKYAFHIIDANNSIDCMIDKFEKLLVTYISINL